MASAIITAIERSNAVIEFDMDGVILRANQNFLEITGYTREEIVGQHHRIFVEPAHAASEAYQRFWERLRSGHFHTAEYKRIGKGGREVWLQASYNPVMDGEGRPVRVIKFAVDITAQFKKAMAMVREQSAALERALKEAQEAEHIRQEMDRTLQEMSTPVIPIWDQILLLPLVGIVDSTRTSDVMKKTLMRIRETRSKLFILDISGVPTVDTAVANQLIKITKATRLMGCETMISGVSPSIAHTVVELGVNLGGVTTTTTLRDALEIALQRVGMSMSTTQHEQNHVA
jgi:methyl-accepting chemotaxis protein